MHIIDGFKTQARVDLSTSDLDSLMMVYAPSMGCFSVSVYHMLVSHSHLQKSFQPLKKLCDFLNCSIEELQQAIITCEQFNLIQSYKHHHDTHDYYLFLLNRPLEMLEFINHEVYGRYLFKVLNSSTVEYIRSLVLNDVISNEGYQEITHTFNHAKLAQWDKELEEEFRQKNAKQVADLPKQIHFDIQLFLKTTSDLLFPIKARTKTNIDQIAYLGSLYGIDEDVMKGFVGKCTNPDDQKVDFDKLKRLVLSYSDHAKTSSKSDYQSDSLTFISSKQNGKAVGVKDKKVVAYLYENYEFEQDAQNMLIEYVLWRFKGAFSQANVQQIADSWKREKIKTLEDAKAHLNQFKPTTQLEEIVPDYMTQPHKKEKSTEDDQKRQALLEKLRKGNQ